MRAIDGPVWRDRSRIVPYSAHWCYSCFVHTGIEGNGRESVIARLPQSNNFLYPEEHRLFAAFAC
jgi:hypothetical protein